MYSVKTIYPEFRCLTIFRKVMKRIESVKGEWWKMRLKFLKQNITQRKCEYSGSFPEYSKKKEREYDEEYDEHKKEIDLEIRANVDGDNWGDVWERIKNKNRDFGRRVDLELPQEIKWLWEEQGKYEMMGKKAEFYQAMLARDKRVRTTSSLNDDVIGVIYSYL